MHREFKLKKADIYNDGKKHLAWKIREKTDATMVLNLQFFSGGHTVSDMKDDGKVVFNDKWNYRGIGWNKYGDFEDITTAEWDKYDNFVSGVSLFHDGSRQNLTKANGEKIYTPDVGRKSGNTALGKLKDGRAFVICEKEGKADKTPEEVQDYLKKLYGDNLLFALLVDGGGSSQLSIAGDEFVYSSRPVLTLLCLWYETKLSVVDYARGEIGRAEPYGDDKYIKWYNDIAGVHLPLNVAWCACFASWCGRHYEHCFKPFCSCTAGMRWFKASNFWYDTPKIGDFIFFSWDNDRSTSEHVGIVEEITKDYIHTIEGNSGNSVRRCKHRATSYNILGYGRIDEEVPWQDAAREWARKNKISDGTRPQWYCTREQVWEMLRRMHEDV